MNPVSGAPVKGTRRVRVALAVLRGTVRVLCVVAAGGLWVALAYLLYEGGTSGRFGGWQFWLGIGVFGFLVVFASVATREAWRETAEWSVD